MTDILDLPQWAVLSSSLSDGTYTISAEYGVALQACTKCGGLFFEDERAVWMPTDEGDDRKHCLCNECNERSITHAMEQEAGMDYVFDYTPFSE